MKHLRHFLLFLIKGSLFTLLFCIIAYGLIYVTLVIGQETISYENRPERRDEDGNSSQYLL